MCAPTMVAILVCPPVWEDGAHRKAPNSAARHQEGTCPMSPKPQAVPSILAKWAKGMHHPCMGTGTNRSPIRCEQSLSGSVTRLLTRPSRLCWPNTTTHTGAILQWISSNPTGLIWTEFLLVPPPPGFYFYLKKKLLLSTTCPHH